MSSYYELRCAVVEMFYDTLRAENYTIGQAASRCLVEFRREIHGGGQDAAVVLSVILSRVARYDPAALVRFKTEIAQLRHLAQSSGMGSGLARGERERLEEDLRFVAEKATGQNG